MINSTMNLKLTEIQKKAPKGASVESDYARAYEALSSELKSKYPMKGEAKKMSYGSRGDAFGA